MHLDHVEVEIVFMFRETSCLSKCGKRFLHKRAQRCLRATVPNIFVAREERPCSTSFRGRPNAVFRVADEVIVIHNDNISIGKKEVHVKVTPLPTIG